MKELESSLKKPESLLSKVLSRFEADDELFLKNEIKYFFKNCPNVKVRELSNRVLKIESYDRVVILDPDNSNYRFIRK